MPKPKRKNHKSVTVMVSDTRRKPQPQKGKSKPPAGVTCTRIAVCRAEQQAIPHNRKQRFQHTHKAGQVEFAGRLNEKNFEDWVRRQSNQRGHEIIVYNVSPPPTES